MNEELGMRLRSLITWEYFYRIFCTLHARRSGKRQMKQFWITTEKTRPIIKMSLWQQSPKYYTKLRRNIGQLLWSLSLYETAGAIAKDWGRGGGHLLWPILVSGNGDSPFTKQVQLAKIEEGGEGGGHLLWPILVSGNGDENSNNRRTSRQSGTNKRLSFGPYSLPFMTHYTK